MRKRKEENAGVVRRRHHTKKKREKIQVDEKERKEETHTKSKMERNIDHNLLCNIKEGKSGVKPEGKKRQEITLHYKKCIRK